jgi:hypothetical protein
MRIDHGPESYGDIGTLVCRPRTPADRRRHRSFVYLWEPTKTGLEARGWGHRPGSIVEIYGYPSRPNNLKRLWLSPTRGVLRIRLDCQTSDVYRRGCDGLRNCRQLFDLTTVVLDEHPRLLKQFEPSFQVQTSLDELLGSVQGSNDLANRLAGFILPIVDLMATC